MAGAGAKRLAASWLAERGLRTWLTWPVAPPVVTLGRREPWRRTNDRSSAIGSPALFYIATAPDRAARRRRQLLPARARRCPRPTTCSAGWCRSAVLVLGRPCSTRALRRGPAGGLRDLCVGLFGLVASSEAVYYTIPGRDRTATRSPAGCASPQGSSCSGSACHALEVAPADPPTGCCATRAGAAWACRRSWS